MSDDFELVEDFLLTVADRYTAIEIVDILGLSEWQIIEAFREELLNKKEEFIA